MEWKQWEGHVVDGRFHLRRYLGGSGHSAVFLTEFGEGETRKAAIKLVPADSAQAEVWMLRRELAGKLSHPGLVAILQFGSGQLGGTGLIYAVMEYCEEDLSQVIPVRPLEPDEARELLAAVVDALAYIHGQGFVHGHLSPSNIMAAGDSVKLSADGLLRIGESSENLWEPVAAGPPESREGLTEAGDVWSLGMTLVEALTQHVPAWDRTGKADPAVPPETLPAPFLDIARRCLRADPRARCSVAEIALRLRPGSPALPLPSNQPVVAEAPPRVSPKASIQVPPKRRYVLPIAAVLLMGVVAMGLKSLNRASAPSEQPVVQANSEALPPVPKTGELAPPVGQTPPSAPIPAPAAVSEPAPPVAEAKAPPATPATGPATGEVVERALPDVPREYLRTIRGKVDVRVRVRVDPSGRVVDAELDSRAASRYFDRESLAAARRWRFTPEDAARQDTPRTWVVRFEFRREGCEASTVPARSGR